MNRINIDLSNVSAKIYPKLLANIEKGTETKYFPGELTYDWEQRCYLKNKKGTYDSLLEKFLERPPNPEGESKDNIMIVIGGIGTGKSTGISRALNKVFLKNHICPFIKKSNKDCQGRPNKILLDFRDWSTTEEEPNFKSNSESAKTQALERFWNVVAANLGKHVPDNISIDEEITYFFDWCSQQYNLLASSSDFHKFIMSVAPISKSVIQGNTFANFSIEDSKKVLFNDRKKFVNSFSSETHTWYLVFKLIYLLNRSGNPCKCQYLFVDNVDHLDPFMQPIVVRFAVRLSSYLNARTIIAIRPLTWVRSMHGHRLLRSENHFSPQINHVIDGRVEEFIKEEELSQNEKIALRSLKNILVGKAYDPLLSNLLKATSGISIRFGLRNFANLLSSPLLSNVTIVNNKIKIRISKLVRSYFFSDSNSILNHAFENLYSIEGDQRIEHTLVKIRILDYLYRKRLKIEPIYHLYSFTKQYGYTEKTITSALNELMKRTRPLLWSEDHFTIINPKSMARIMITPIGESYYKNLYGEIFYDEACIAKGLHDTVGLNEIQDFHLKLCEQDFLEIKFCLENYSPIAYQEVYSSECPSLSYLHWQNFKIGFLKRARKERLHFDPLREEWIKSQVLSLLKH